MKVRIAIISMMIVLSSMLLYCNQNSNRGINANDKYSNAENILNDTDLNLTTKQKSAISVCVSKHRVEGAEINKKIAVLNRQIGQEMRAHVVSKKAIDKDKIKRLVIDKKMLEAELEYLTIMTDIDILSNLDEKQLKTLEERHKGNRHR